jgi:hypothetical protein
MRLVGLNRSPGAAAGRVVRLRRPNPDTDLFRQVSVGDDRVCAVVKPGAGLMLVEESAWSLSNTSMPSPRQFLKEASGAPKTKQLVIAGWRSIRPQRESTEP